MKKQQTTQESHWIVSLNHFLKIKRVFVISGNINDTVLYKTSRSVMNLDFNSFLLQFFIDHEYRIVAFCDDFGGFTIPDASHQKLYTPCNNTIQDVNQLICQKTYPCVIILRFISDESHDMFTILQSALMQMLNKGHQHTMIVCLFEQPKAIPSWLYQNYATVHTIDIGLPTENDRQTYLSLNYNNFYSSQENDSSTEKNNCIQKFASLTQGLMLREISTLQEISKRHQISIDHYHQLVRQYKFGSQSQSWEIINSQTFERAEKILKDRIKGQDEIIYAILDTLKRAAIGLSGVSTGTQSNCPRSVMFFAGPTGVGKTEMTRCIADIFLGDQSQLFRLDMNEYSEHFAESKIFGAIQQKGQDAIDGCLVRQVSQYPASMIVFENIESAHPSVLDRLPKILTDGYMIGPNGNTIFFSETIIVFTSSIGSAQGKIGDKKYDFTETGFMPKYEIVKQLIFMTVENHFKVRLKRPKLFHCLGDNIFVFDFIRGSVIPEIIDKMLKDVIIRISQRIGITITCSDQVNEMIHESVLRKDVHGARGIANVIEHVMVNPLSRYFFDHDHQGKSLYISHIRRHPNQAFELYEIEVGDEDISQDIDLTDI
jgi:ATP-dependent Clp protease ATP-binding subunit ClpA